jgi:hypothetical protein
MSEAGYTATEALAALFIIGLAVSGVASGLAAVGKTHAIATEVTAESVRLRTAEDALTRLTAGQGPFRADEPQGFHGDATSFTFACGQQRCGARVTGRKLIVFRGDKIDLEGEVPSADALSFGYAAPTRIVGTWPPAAPPGPETRPETLRAIAMFSGDEPDVPLTMSPIWIGQRADCEFDVTVRDCRARTP